MTLIWLWIKIKRLLKIKDRSLTSYLNKNKEYKRIASLEEHINLCTSAQVHRLKKHIEVERTKSLNTGVYFDESANNQSYIIYENVRYNLDTKIHDTYFGSIVLPYGDVVVSNLRYSVMMGTDNNMDFVKIAKPKRIS